MARVTIQMGHVNGLPSQPGTQGEQDYVKKLAPCIAARLRWHGHSVTIVDAIYQLESHPPLPPGDVFISLHCDGNSNTDVRGAIVGYPDNLASRELAQAWKLAYQRLSWPDGPGRFFRPDNLTPAMSQYYMWAQTGGYSYRYLAEHGALTNPHDKAWMQDHIDQVAQAHVEAIEYLVPTQGVVGRHPIRRQPHAGWFIQGNWGTVHPEDPASPGTGNYELVASSRTGGMFHRWRDDAPGSLWTGGDRFGGTERIAAASLIQSTFGCPYGHFEVIARIEDRLAHLSRDAQNRWTVNENPITIDPGEGKPIPITGVAGNPALIQSKSTTADRDDSPRRGNFHLVVPLSDGSIVHYERVNDELDHPLWRGPEVIYTGPVQDGGIAVSLIQSNYGRGDSWNGNLEVVARIGDKLAHFYRDSSRTWRVGQNPLTVRGAVIRGVSGRPCLIQSDFGRQGNFELVTPHAGGGLAHYLRNNDRTEGWTLAYGSPFATEWQVGEASVIQSGSRLHVLARVISRDSSRIRHFYNDGQWRTGDWADEGLSLATVGAESSLVDERYISPSHSPSAPVNRPA